MLPPERAGPDGAPRTIATAQRRNYRAAKVGIPALPHVKHALVNAAARANNRAEKCHQPIYGRERQLRCLRDAHCGTRFFRVLVQSGGTLRCPDIR